MDYKKINKKYIGLGCYVISYENKKKCKNNMLYMLGMNLLYINV